MYSFLYLIIAITTIIIGEAIRRAKNWYLALFLSLLLSLYLIRRSLHI